MNRVKKLLALLLFSIGFFTEIYYTWANLSNFYHLGREIALILIPLALVLTLVAVVPLGD